jgi:hypothetical protein
LPWLFDILLRQYALGMADSVEPIADTHRFDAEAIWTGMGPSAEMEAVGIQSVLSAAGIEAIINGSAQIPTVPFEVLVAHDKAARAREVIAEALASGPEAAEEGERASELS